MTGHMIRVALVLALVAFALCAPASADDYGPRRGVREVRAAVPIIEHARTAALAMGAVTGVDDAIVGHDRAIVDFHGPHGRGIAVLTYAEARWWLVGATYEDVRGDASWWDWETPATPLTCARTSTAPTAAFLRTSLGADVATAALWSAHASPPASGQRSTSLPGNLVRDCLPDIYPTPYPLARVTNDDGYRVGWTTSGAWGGVLDAHGRSPTDAEMSGPGANSIFYLYANGGATALAVPKSTLTIWCPFVLDPSVHYFIEFSGADAQLGPIHATLDDNTLMFEIPAFAAPSDADLRGEVDYLPYRPQ